MHSDRGIVRTDIWSDGRPTRPDDSNTLSRQYDGTNDAPMDPLHGPVTGAHYSCKNKNIKNIPLHS